MSKNLDGIVAAIRDKRAQKRPEVETNLNKIDALLAALRDTRARASTVAARYPDLSMALQGVSFNDAENNLLKARAACEAALTRLRRESINIGVAGKARQGKSQILQMLTGLGDKQIPTGNGGFCTASRSIVHNRDGKSATIHYLTESALLTQKIYPSYAPKGSSDVALGLSPRPVSVAAFISNELPTVPDTESEEALINWEKVCKLQSDLRANPALVGRLGAAPEPVPLDSVRDYLVKDKGETNYQVVDYVEIVTPFDTDLPKGMTVYDLPGLEDPSPGIRETMLKCVSEDADIVFLLRMPKNTGDDWDKADLRTMTELKEIYPNGEVLPKDWIQLVLNLDKRPDSHNENNVNRMAEKAPRRFSPVICDCGSKDAVREMVDANIDSLVSQAGRIDDLRIRQAGEAFATAQNEVRSLYERLHGQTGNMLASQPALQKLLKGWKRDFMGNLRDPFGTDKTASFKTSVQTVLEAAFADAEQALEKLYDDCDDDAEFPPDFPAFSKKRLLGEFKQSHGPEEVENLAVRNQREAVLSLLRSKLSKCCDDLIGSYFDCVVETAIDPNPPLCQIAPPCSDGTESSRQRLERLLAELRQSECGPYSVLDPAVSDLLKFTLSFDTSILPAIVGIKDLDDFDPTIHGGDLDVNLKSWNKSLGEEPADKVQKADATFNWLKMKSESILSKVTSGSDSSPLTSITEHVVNTMKANFKTFEFRLIWGDGCEDDWNRFIEENKHRLWPAEFEAAMANSQVAKDWSAALESLRVALA